MHIWCQTTSPTPRKVAHPEISSNPIISVTLGSKPFPPRTANATWTDPDGIRCVVCIDIETLRAMLKAAEEYKPGSDA